MIRALSSLSVALLGIVLGLPAAGAASPGPHPGVGQAPAVQASTLPGDSLRLDVLLEEAMEWSPRLVALRSVAEAASHRIAEAGTLPDPMLSLGAMNLGLPELDAGMPASMVPSIQLSQTFPFFGKLGLRESMAGDEARMAQAAVREEEWRIRREVAEHFHALFALDRILEVHRGTLALLQDFQSVARSLYASGSGRQSDVLRADVEVARMDAEIRRLAALRIARSAELNAVLDRPGESPLASPVAPGLPSRVPPLDTLLAWAMSSRPALQQERIQADRARSGVELADRGLWPDFTISAQYGRRGGENPRSMGGLMIGASLPIHSGSRQRPRVEAARALQRHAVSRVSRVRAAVEAELRAAVSELERARGLVGLYRDEILPAARVNVSSSLAAYRVGEVDFSTLVDAQLDVDRYQEEYIQLLADYGTAFARLEAAVGRTLPSDESEPAPLGMNREIP